MTDPNRRSHPLAKRAFVEGASTIHSFGVGNQTLCPHTDREAREATREEVAALPFCQTCDAMSEAVDRTAVQHWTCAGCFIQNPAAVGECQSCGEAQPRGESDVASTPAVVLDAHTSNEALKALADSLVSDGFTIEPTIKGKRPDAWRESDRTMVEVEGVRTFEGNQWQADLIKAEVLGARNVIFYVKAKNTNYRDRDDAAKLEAMLDELSWPRMGINRPTVIGWLSGDLHPAECWCPTCKETWMDGEPVYRFDKELEAEAKQTTPTSEGD